MVDKLAVDFASIDAMLHHNQKKVRRHARGNNFTRILSWQGIDRN
jgi:hypothetical protein